MEDRDLAIVIGKRVRALRVEKNLSLKDLAAKSGVAQSALVEAEKGTSFATVVTLDKLAQAFGVTPADLVNGTEDDIGYLVETMRTNPKTIQFVKDEATRMIAALPQPEA